MPVWLLEDTRSRESLEQFIRHTAAGAETVTWLLTRAIEWALYAKSKNVQEKRHRIEKLFDDEKKKPFWKTDRQLKSARENVGERFYRETEPEFYAMLHEARQMIEKHPDGDDPTLDAREAWARAMADAALRIFDEEVPMHALEARNLHRQAMGRALLKQALKGHSRGGQRLFERDLSIASPETARVRKGRKEAA